MSSHTVRLIGMLVDGIVGIGGETTGFEIQIGSVDVDASKVKNAGAFTGKTCLAAGLLEIKNYPVRHDVETLVAAALASNLKDLPKETLRTSSAFLTGTFQMPVARPGGDGPDAQLSDVSPEVDVSAVNATPFVGKLVAATGKFEIVSYPTRGQVFVFKATGLKAPSV
jgi:hypothetical protein